MIIKTDEKRNINVFGTVHVVVDLEDEKDLHMMRTLYEELASFVSDRTNRIQNVMFEMKPIKPGEPVPLVFDHIIAANAVD